MRQHGEVPSDEADARLAAVLEVRDRNLAHLQGELVGQTLEVLIDEGSDEGGTALGRTCMDAPEVDPRVIVQGDVAVGQRIQVAIDGVLENFDLTGRVI